MKNDLGCSIAALGGIVKNDLGCSIAAWRIMKKSSWLQHSCFGGL
ncbi:hypothetical protein [Clostridium sp. YIM B02555]|nr:hypothetical protein [Clostridium sp. YIM B02555]